jgi:hypothetical protein
LTAPPPPTAPKRCTPSKKQLDAEDSRYASTRFRESEVVMGLSALMDLGQADSAGHSSTDPAPLKPTPSPPAPPR